MPEDLEGPQKMPRMFGGLTVRSVALGVIITLILSWVVPYNSLYIKDPGLEAGFLPAIAVFVVAMLSLAINPLLKKVWPGTEFSAAELTLIWVMTAFGAAAATLSIGTIVPSVIGGMFNYATEGNKWADKFLHHIPTRLTPSIDPNARVIRALFEGLDEGETIPWSLWARPLFYWGLLMVLLYVFFFALSVILRRQWVERERLPFPLVRLPIEMVQEPQTGRFLNNFFSNRLMWVGFGISAFVAAAYQIGATFPTLPASIKLEFPLWTQLQTPPWNMLHITTMRLSPVGLGIVFILPVQVSFSIWFFFFFARFELLMKGIIGYPRSSPREPFMIYQEAGTIVAFVVFTFWLARPHLRDVVKKAITGKGVDDSQEAFSYRTAFFGFLLSLLGLALWCRFVAEISTIVTIAFLFLFATIVIVLTKVVAQGGLMFLAKGFQPDMLMTSLVRPSIIGMQSLSTLLLLEWTVMGGLQHSVFPQTMNTFKLGDAARVHKRSIFAAIIIVLLLGAGVSFYFSTKITYNHGAAYLSGLSRPPKRAAQEILRYNDLFTTVYEPKMEDEVARLRKLISDEPALRDHSSEELALDLLEGDSETRRLVEQSAERAELILAQADESIALLEKPKMEDEVSKLRKLILNAPALRGYSSEELAIKLLQSTSETRRLVQNSAEQAELILSQADESAAPLEKATQDEVSRLQNLLLDAPELTAYSSEELAIKLLEADSETRRLVVELSTSPEQAEAILSQADDSAALLEKAMQDEASRLRNLISQARAFMSYSSDEVAIKLLQRDSETRQLVQQSAEQAELILSQADESIALLMKEYGKIPEVVVTSKPTKYSRTHALFFFIGAALMFVVYFFQSRLYWWPFHPIGLLVADMSTVLAGGWFTMLIGWFIKRAVLSFGGGKAYKRLVPAFLGLIMGDAFVKIVAAVLRIITDTPAGISR